MGEFRGIVKAALGVARSSVGSEALAPRLEEILRFLRENESMRPEMESEIYSMLDEIAEDGMVELISYAMYALRWEGVAEEVERRLSHPSGDVSNRRLYEAVLDSFSDSWRDRDLYDGFE
ncbi:hypothetical protein ACQPZG_00045 (plasmid) [Streptomyces sp. CA-294286]|uniref:hypothetical protein n=1 Tax=Streptomyces sp. CA-294286 TaxID=3240070 RepID=UPI003D8E6DDD